MPRCYAGFGPFCARTGLFRLAARRIGIASQVLRFCVRSQLSQSRSLLFSRRSLAVSTCFFLHAAMNLRPPFLTVSTHTSASNTVSSYPLAAKRPDIALYAVGPLVLLPTPSTPHCTINVSQYDSLWQPPTAYSDERPRPQSLLVRSVILMLSHPVISRARLYEVIRWSCLLRCAPMMRSKTRGVRCGLWSRVLGQGSMYCIHKVGFRLPRSLPFGS